MVNSNSEKDQTLNQLLIAMDGFSNEEDIFVIGSTNRLDLLDSALLRPGRMDKKVYIGSPDSATRKEILNIHLKGKPLDKLVHVDSIVEMTGGYSGAQIENLLNEAMLYVLRNDRELIEWSDLEYINNRILAGWQDKESKFSEEMIDRIKTILGAAKKAEKKACLHCVKTSYAIQAIKWGFDLVTLNSDTRLLVSSASQSINEFRNGLK